MGTTHDAGGTGTGTGTGTGADTGTTTDAITNPEIGTNPVVITTAGADTAAQVDGRAPGAHRSWRTVLTIGLGAIATLISALATAVTSTSARITYYLPPPDGSTEATEHHDWIESVLALIPVSLVAGLLALVATVLGIVALVRRRKAALWQLVLAGLALVIALAVLVAVPILLNGIGTY